jgi:co-chaperonin GroES (HSP10)
MAVSSSGVRLDRQTTDLIPKEAKIRPLRDHIIVKPLEWNPSKTIKVYGSTRKPLRGVVVAAGPGHYPKKYNQDRSKTWDSKAFRHTEVKPGDIVELGGLEVDGYSFPQILIGNELHLIAREEDVCGVVEDGLQWWNWVND